ncbi:tetraacyldisaccharide 4'-kinase [Agriterribacter sp.]|uniref:tetraacyldisaccharide 4'-kinase n=1 Tax=Agriterribacter sp. TaxID=2821509 RepID=UPI002C869709|nr:tetraacyldisaccharide 4'-kinase [Agriterribacter sp.]HRO46413.1 tetraacyldisaccharide 4'-kinase [Agriterribacter sp.]HRQ17601.1 tetraacyldisaccharide 4'-kinase [Agriterribacter sp.]
MNFSSVWLRSFRVLLFPFAFLYGTAVKVRNYLYDNEIIQSVEFNFPVICIGNISVGGTGKSPMVEYLLRLLMHRYKTATLSRGYKRKTRGYVLADDKTTALDIGDEPMQFHIKFPEVTVAVGEERAIAIPQLLFDRPETDVIILDDALQHRAVKAGFNILLTDYNNLFTRDIFLPTGDLRDSRSSYKRADIIVVTKCSDTFCSEQKHEIMAEIKPTAGQHLFFTGIRYGAPYHIISRGIKRMSKETEVLLACGIANPAPLKQHIQESCASYDAIYYRDHYIFTIDDLKEIRQRFEKLAAQDKMIIVTEKDAVRLVKFAAALKNMPVYVQPIETYFLFNESQRFNFLIENFIQGFKIKS